MKLELSYISRKKRKKSPTNPTVSITFSIQISLNFVVRDSSVGIATRYGIDGQGIESIAGSLPTEAVGLFLLEKSTACSTIRYKRQLKVQYQNNEAQDTTNKQKKILVGLDFLLLIVLKSGSLNYLEQSWPLQVCNGIDLPLPLPYLTENRLCFHQK
jgi:hypothetical protein